MPANNKHDKAQLKILAEQVARVYRPLFPVLIANMIAMTGLVVGLWLLINHAV